LKKQLRYSLFLLLWSYFSYSQNVQLSPKSEISILTVGSGKQLYDTFGHSAIRILDRKNGLDNVYNYGMFEFSTPNFYTKFAQGKLLYDLGRYPFYIFLKDYMRENREVKEQVLQLTLDQKQRYFDFLENNAKPENRKYLYDFFFDNCATKLRDVTTEVLGDKVNYKDELLKNNLTFRDLIYQKLDEHPWGTFGIDIALSSLIDRKATAKEYTFLPENVFKGFKNAVVVENGIEKPLVKSSKTLYEHKTEKSSKSFFTPMFVFSILALFVLFLTFKDYKKKPRTSYLDFIILFSTGLIGLLVFLLWFATDHKTTANNFNILWAFMPNIFVSFLVIKNKKSKFLKMYYAFLLVLIIGTVLVWIFKIQVFNLALIPILILLVYRYFYNFKTL
jgi:hypothetical protein